MLHCSGSISLPRWAAYFISAGLLAASDVGLFAVHCRADAPRGAAIADVPALCTEAEKLVPLVDCLEDRLRIENAITYLKYRNQPDEARARFQRIQIEIEAGDDLSDPETDDSEDDIHKDEEKLKVAEWMARSGLTAESLELMRTIEAEHRDERGGIGEPWIYERSAIHRAMLGRRTEARNFLAMLPADDDSTNDTLTATIAVAHEFRRRGDKSFAAELTREALAAVERSGYYDYYRIRLLLSELRHHDAEPEIVRLLAEAERAKVAADLLLRAQVEYLQLLVDRGRVGEARAIVARLSKEIHSDEDTAFFSAALGDHSAAIEEAREQRISPKYPQDEGFRSSVITAQLQLLSIQMLQARRIPAAKRYFDEYLAARTIETPDPLIYTPEQALDALRDYRFYDASFAVACGEHGALLKLAKQEPNTDRFHAEFVCRCYLATALATEPPHDAAPVNPFLSSLYREFGSDERL